MEEKKWPAEPASSAGSIKLALYDNEARKKLAVTIGVSFGTVQLLKFMVQTLADHGDEPATLVLELSAWVSLLLYLWVVFVTRVLTTDRRRCLGVRALLAVLASITAAVVVSTLAYDAISAVVGMLLMYLVALCVAGFFAWCLGDYLRTRNSAETPSTSAPDESQEALLPEKSSANAKVAREHNNARDLEAGLLPFAGP